MTVRRIATIQAGLRTIGHIRMGELVHLPDGRIRPASLTTFRLTSPSRDAIDSVAEVYGGQVSAWTDAPSTTHDRWQITIESPFLDVICPPNAYTSSFELWSAAGCLRRCDGLHEEITNGPCLCPANPAERMALAAKGEACKPTSRLRVVLPLLRGLGAWPLVSHSFNAVVELGAMADLLAEATMKGWSIPARLVLEQRTVKRPGIGRDGKPTTETHHFTVPVLEIPDLTPQQLLGAGTTPDVPMLRSGAPDLPRAEEEDIDDVPVEEEDAEGPHEAVGATQTAVPLGSGAPALPATDASGVAMTLTEIQSRAEKKNVYLSDLNARSRALFGANINLLTNAQRQTLAEDQGLA